MYYKIQDTTQQKLIKKMNYKRKYWCLAMSSNNNNNPFHIKHQGIYLLLILALQLTSGVHVSILE